MARAASKAALARALAALDAAGLMAGSIVIRPGGEVEITPVPKAERAAPALTAPAATAKPENLDEWRERKNGRRAHQGP